jgi:hypothetical protein
VWQIHRAPVAIVERKRAGSNKITCLLKIARLSAPESKVFGSIVRIPEVEAPPKIQQKSLAPRAWFRRFGGLADRKRRRLLLRRLNRSRANRTQPVCRRYSWCEQPSLQHIPT